MPHQIYDRNEENLTRKYTQSPTKKHAKNLRDLTFSLHPQAMAKQIFTNKYEEYIIWYKDTLTMPKLQYSQIIPSYKYKILSQNKSFWDSIPSLGLHLIQREVFSSVYNPPQNPFKEIFHSYILPQNWLTQSKITSLLNIKLHIYIAK